MDNVNELPPWVYTDKTTASLPPLGALVEFYTNYSVEPHIGRLIKHPEGDGYLVWFVEWPVPQDFQQLRHKDCIRIWRAINPPSEHALYMREKQERYMKLLAESKTAFIE